jgi:hypothetical protein
MHNKILVGKPERNKSVDRRRRGKEDNIKIVLTESVEWIYLAQDRNQWRALVNTITKFLVPRTGDF